MTLALDVRAHAGTLRLDVGFEVGADAVVALVGPNGAGKTTLLRVLAGLISPDDARVDLAGRVLDDTAAGVREPPARRRLGVVFQDYLLFPHLSAIDNVAFGPRVTGASPAQARRSAAGWLERLGVAHRANARPEDLSGGEAQRVALARALAVEPAALLLDEPLAALDVATRRDIRRELREHLDDFAGPVLVVTHEPVEAATLAERIVVLEDGHVTQEGTIADVTRHPRSSWVARLVGMNLYRGTGRGREITLGGDTSVVAADEAHGPVFAAFAPRAVALFRERPAGTPRNAWRGVVGALDVVGDRVRIPVSGPLDVVAEVTPAAVADLDLAAGGHVWAIVKATEVSVYPR